MGQLSSSIQKFFQLRSFYASIARSEHDARDFDSYSGRVLILDEVDALVIDEEPNEPPLGKRLPSVPGPFNLLGKKEFIQLEFCGPPQKIRPLILI